MGPDGATALASALRAEGYEVRTGQSDWMLSAESDGPLIAALAEGSANAVRPLLGDIADAWLEARTKADTVMIGHIDVLAIPPGWTSTD